MSLISDKELVELLQKEQCGEEFIKDALRYKRFYNGDLEEFIEKVEAILYALEKSDDEMESDDAFDDDAFEEEFGAFDEDEPLEEGDEDDEDDEEER